MRKFFGINENKYKFEIWDLTSLITVLNVTFIVMGMWWAPILGLVNCATCIILNIINHNHVNAYITQIALIVLNTYFLSM